MHASACRTPTKASHCKASYSMSTKSAFYFGKGTNVFDYQIIFIHKCLYWILSRLAILASINISWTAKCAIFITMNWKNGGALNMSKLQKSYLCVADLLVVARLQKFDLSSASYYECRSSSLKHRCTPFEQKKVEIFQINTVHQTTKMDP